MVSSTTRKIISLAISLLVVVISLTGVALGANPPSVTNPTRFTPGFNGAPGKMARDTAGNFYVTDFWGKGIVKLNKQLTKTGFLSTSGRPTAVAALADGRLVVVMSKPTPKVVFYSQATGDEVQFAPLGSLFNPTGITIDATGQIYVVDSGDSGNNTNPSPTTINVPHVNVYSSAGAYLNSFGSRAAIGLDAPSATLDQFKMPMGIAYESTGDNLVVVDSMNQRLVFFTAYKATAQVCADTVLNGTTPKNVCMVKSIGDPSGVSGVPVDNNTTVVKFGDLTDVAFEYSGSVLNRMYVAERGNGNLVVVDPVNKYSLLKINGTNLSGAEMKYPSGVVFEKTSTGGMVYVSNAAATNSDNVLALSIDNGSIPSQQVAMTMVAVPPVAPSNPLTVSGTTSPANAVTCSVNGVTVVPATGTGTWSASLPLVAGNNYILCQSTLNGVTTSKEANTYSGTTSGTLTATISQPAASPTLYTQNSTVTVKGTVSGIANLANTTVQLENNSVVAATTQTNGSGNWSAVVNLAEGSNLITATASKSGAATSAPVSVTVVADYTAPAMTISFLNNGATTNKAVQNLDGVVTEVNLGSITVNGVPVPATEMVSMAGNNTYFSVPVTLVRGKNTVTVTATDLAGSSTTITRGSTGNEITLTPEIPGMTVALPADNSYMTSAVAVTASGTVDTTFTAVNAAGTPVTPAAGVWSTSTMSVSAGFGSYQFTASGAGNATVTEKRTINTDAAFSPLAITSPAADLATNASSVVISGTVPTASPIPQILIDGVLPAVNVTTYDSVAGTFSHTVSLPSQGIHSVKVIAANGTTAIRNIIYDTTLPDLTIQADSKPMPTTITGTIEPSATISAITASLGGTPVAIPASVVTFDAYDQSGAVTWHANLNGYAYDTISFTTLDPAGNPATLAYKQGIPTGDIDGDGSVRLADALASLRHVAGTENITDPIKFFNGDVGGLVKGRAARDGVIDIQDSVLILNKAYGLLAF